jgi:diacylglycerol O-acyltransferase / wax synthase
VEQLGGLDTALLYCETPGMHMHVCGMALLDPSPRPPEEMYERIRTLLLGVMPNVPMMRKRLATVPLGMGRPFWVDDVDFDLDRHLRRVHVRPPGDDRSLADLIGELASVPLARDRPLWEVSVIEGLADGRVGLLAKIHHAGIDGTTALNVMSQVFDLHPSRPATSSSPALWRPKRPPGRLGLWGTGLATLARSPFGVLRLMPLTAGRLGAVAWGRRIRHDEGQAATLFRAPRTSFNATLTARRSVAFADIPLSQVKRVKEAYGVKINDVIVATVAGALRRYLEARGELPPKPLVAAEPVSVHGRAPSPGGITRLSVMFSTLATDEEDPAKRLQVIASANARAKEVTNLVGADTLIRWSEYVWCYGYAVGARLYSALHLADHHPVVYNLLLSNVPGPPVALYLAGARCTAIYPFGPIFDGAGLNVTAITSDDRIGFGVIACPDLVPSVWDVAEALPASLDELLESIGRRVPNATARPSHARTVAQRYLSPRLPDALERKDLSSAS